MNEKSLLKKNLLSIILLASFLTMSGAVYVFFLSSWVPNVYNTFRFCALGLIGVCHITIIIALFRLAHIKYDSLFDPLFFIVMIGLLPVNALGYDLFNNNFIIKSILFALVLVYLLFLFGRFLYTFENYIRLPKTIVSLGLFLSLSVHLLTIGVAKNSIGYVADKAVVEYEGKYYFFYVTKGSGGWGSTGKWALWIQMPDNITLIKFSEYPPSSHYTGKPVPKISGDKITFCFEGNEHWFSRDPDRFVEYSLKTHRSRTDVLD